MHWRGPEGAVQLDARLGALGDAACRRRGRAPAPKPSVSPEERYKMVQDAAYFIAERHGFNGDSAYFWTLAEAEIASQLGE